jgi:beta-N-acetylhexosaminidase
MVRSLMPFSRTSSERGNPEPGRNALASSPHKEPLQTLLQRLTLILLLVLLCLQPFSQPSTAYADRLQQESSLDQQARDLLARMTPRERVGQLFLVTFDGTDAGSESQIYDLINNYHIGGVVLLAENNNFTWDATLENVVALTNQLQTDEWEAAQRNRADPATNENYTPQFIPLFIGISQEGDGFPNDQILNGLSPLPNQMALGATWNPALARQVGSVLGQELSALGFNLLLGPSLDVLEATHTEGSRDLGTRTFGSNPYWVGQLGREYITGIHQGSDNRIAVVAKHFPGAGASDRLPEEEVATIRKSQSQLRDFDLVPFLSVMGEDVPPESTVDALLTSHTRYQGFQGSIRDVTRPFSLDPSAFAKLVEQLPQLAHWRSNSGVVVSDNLGSRAVRRYYELIRQEFDPERIARNALYAGSDLLYIDDFSTTLESSSYAAAARTLDQFALKYREDPLFSERVDEAVLRILKLKLKLYGEFALEQVLVSPENLAEVGKNAQATVDVARQSATLISPTLTELNETVPDPPDLYDRIVFITDTRRAQQCSGCPVQQVIDARALEEVVLRRYGPQGSGQIGANNVVSYTLEELQAILEAGRGDSQMERDLGRAHWIVFSMQNPSAAYPSYDILKNFLTNRPDLFQQKRVVVFAFSAPYYLDATNISKLTAYYGLYSKAPQFIDMAAYLLFREIPAEGAPPVSVTGVYNLNEAIQPDPDQLIPLTLDLPTSTESEAVGTAEPVLNYGPFRVGDIVPVRTGVILDNNGNPVPDGTPVDFILSMAGEVNSQVRQMEYTVGGVTRTTFQVTSTGSMNIRVESGPARQSQVLNLEIIAEFPAGSEPSATPTLEPTPLPTETPTPTVTPEPTETPTGAIGEVAPPRQPRFSDWFIAILITATVAWSTYRLSAMLGNVRWGVRAGFLALIGGLAAYSYLALQMPGTENLLNGSVARGVILVTLTGTAIGLASTWLWRTIWITTNGNGEGKSRS